MRPNTEMAPDPADTGLANAQLFGQPIAAPVVVASAGPRRVASRIRGLPPRRYASEGGSPDNANPVLPNALLESASSTPGYTRRCNPDAPELHGKNDLRLTSK